MTGTRPAKTERPPSVWLGHTPTGQQLARMDLADFRHAIDQLHRDTVPKSYYDKVVARRQAQAWDVR